MRNPGTPAGSRVPVYVITASIALFVFGDSRGMVAGINIDYTLLMDTALFTTRIALCDDDMTFL
jgi:hypothetical protein